MIARGDALTVLSGMKDKSVHCCVTSPPYWGLRDYGVDGQLGLEKTPEEYVEKMVGIFREVRRVLRDDGTLWLNLGDSYASNTRGSGGPSEKQDSNAGSRYGMTGFKHDRKDKDLIGIPWRVAFALQQDGWYLRCDIIWAKPNPMPESVKDRPTKAHEYIFLMSKNQKYYYDADAIKEPLLSSDDEYLRAGKSVRDNHAYGEVAGRKLGSKSFATVPDGRNKRSVWAIPTQPFPDAHFAVFPPKLIEPCILAGCPEGGIVLDPFFGSGTTGLVAKNSARKYFGIELNMEYINMAKRRLSQGVLF